MKYCDRNNAYLFPGTNKLKKSRLNIIFLAMIVREIFTIIFFWILKRRIFVGDVE